MNPKIRQQAQAGAMMFMAGACMIQKAVDLWGEATKAQSVGHQPADAEEVVRLMALSEPTPEQQRRVLAQVLIELEKGLTPHLAVLARSCEHLQRGMTLIEQAPFETADTEPAEAFFEARDDVIRSLMAEMRPFYVNPIVTVIVEHDVSVPAVGQIAVRKMDAFNEHVPAVLATLFTAMAEAQAEQQAGDAAGTQH